MVRGILSKHKALVLATVVMLGGGFSMLEVLFYKGFVLRYFHLDLRFVSVALTLLFILTFLNYLKFQTTNNKYFLLAWLGKLNLLLLLLGCIAFFVFEALETAHYQNYVLSKFSIHYQNIPFVLYFFLLGSFLSILESPKNLYLRFTDYFGSDLTLKVILLFSFLILVLSNLFNQFSIVTKGLHQSFAYVGEPYEARLERRLGGRDNMGWIVAYTSFVKSHTPNNAVIFIPPQQALWEVTGNSGYMRYFLHPRILINFEDMYATIPEEATHVLISHGLWFGNAQPGWPKIDIPAEEIEVITHIDRDTGNVTVYKNTAYTVNSEQETWGLIKLKK